MTWLKISVIFVVVFGFAIVDAAAQYDPCEIPPGIYRTQTQGGWSNDCHGNNPGCVRDTYFPTVFPSGLLVGGNYTILLMTSQAVVDFLPAGGTSAMLTSNHTNPTSTEAGVFAGQVVSLAISLGFSDAGVPGFGDLGSLYIPTGVHTPYGAFAGYTVNEVFAIANIVLGGDMTALPDGISVSDLNDVVDAINNNFDDGEHSDGYLVEEDCDDILPVELTAIPVLIPGDRQLTLSFHVADEHDVTSYTIIRNGSKVAELGNGDGAYVYVDRNLMNGYRYEYVIVAMELGIRNILSYEGATVWSATPSINAAVVSEYALYQNYPNPFNPTTTLSFDLMESGFVSLKVYNLMGQEVVTVISGIMERGRHVAAFNAADLPSGVYIYRLEAGDFMDQKKMMLMK